VALRHPADARLSVHSVEERDATAAVCVVRCVGGVARTGQRFAVEPCDAPTVTLEEILRYGQSVEFVDPPHTAKVRLTGEAVGMVVRGAVVSAVLSG
jgi:ketosteroid isomerase-like protein